MEGGGDGDGRSKALCACLMYQRPAEVWTRPPPTNRMGPAEGPHTEAKAVLGL
jgi:hypothetical protein